MCQTLLKQIFNRGGIANIHKEIVKDAENYFDALDIQPALIDFLVNSTNRSLKVDKIDRNKHMKLVHSLQSTKRVKWKIFGVYNDLEIKVMETRRSFVQDVNTSGNGEILKDTDPKYGDLSKIGKLTSASSVLLAIKYFWIFKRYPLNKYNCFPANTGPVKKATKVLWGNEFKDMLEAKKIHDQLASELDMNVIDVNTALWIIGNEMHKRTKKRRRK